MEPATLDRFLIAQSSGEDLKRDAGLRGEDFTSAVWGLSTVFLVGLLVLGAVIWTGRRRSR